MNAILEPFKALWRRKLWPVAVLLVAALVAVPTLLAKQPVVAEPIAANTLAGDDEELPSAFVAAAATPEDGRRRRVLGASKDPFAPAPLPKAVRAARAKAAAAKKHAASEEAASAADERTSDSGSSGSGSDSGSGGAPATEPPASAAPTPAPTYPKYSIKVRFGQVDGELATKTVERLTVLPSEESPLIVYRGVEDGGKVAVFELTGSVVAMGDGTCDPSPEDCQILKLRADETEFLTVSDTGEETDDQYQLDLEKINVKQTTALVKAGSTGHAILKSLDRKPRYAFDPQTGTLHKVTKKLSRAATRASL